MIRCIRFSSFLTIQDNWKTLEKNNSLYPFQGWDYNNLFAQHFINKNNLLLLGVFDEKKLIATAAFERLEDTAIFVGMKPVLGNQELTDFGDIIIGDRENQLEEIWNAILAYLKKENIQSLRLDYVRDDSKTYEHFKNTQTRNIKVQTTLQEVSPFVSLPKIWDEYLAALNKKQRHELERKLKRLESQLYSVKFIDIVTDRSFDEFVRLHRLSDPKKNSFMSEDMKAFFWELTQQTFSSWKMKQCTLSIDKKTVASLLYFANEKEVLLYNDGYDPAFGQFSPGILLKVLLLLQCLQRGISRFDLLRGGEKYKYDLGAIDKQLYKIEILL